MNKMKNKKLFSKIGTYIIFILFAFITVLPFLWMVSTACISFSDRVDSKAC